jgi:hypothetical protein
MAAKRKVYDIPHYTSYDNDGKELFEGLREAIIKIYPKDDKGKYTEDIEKIAEEVAFGQTDIILKKNNDIIEKKVSVLMTEIESKITTALASVATASAPI